MAKTTIYRLAMEIVEDERFGVLDICKICEWQWGFPTGNPKARARAIVKVARAMGVSPESFIATHYAQDNCPEPFGFCNECWEKI